MSINEKYHTKIKDEAIIVVSGLPRCGTSMMMQMLEAGGLPVGTDYIRKADEDNPRGYYELEKVKKLKEDSTWLEECAGKVFKMVSALLYHLPVDKKYKVIFMKRNLIEMLASQRKMLQRLGQEDGMKDIELEKKFTEHLKKIQKWLQRQPSIEVVYINYSETVQNPDATAKLVNRFLDGRLDEEKMVGVVQTSLYRQRK